MYCAPTHPPPQKIILGTLLNDTAFFKERNLAKYLHTEFAHIPASYKSILCLTEYRYRDNIKFDSLDSILGTFKTHI